jgi:hypothetical protein
MTVHRAPPGLTEPGRPTNLATAAAILDLLLGVLVGVLAASLAADNLASIRAAAPDPVTFTPPFPLSAPITGTQQQGGYSDWLAILFTASVGTAAVLFVVAGIYLLVRRAVWATRVGEVAVAASVVLIDGSLFYAASTCEEMGCLVVPFAFVSGIVVTVAGGLAWLLHRSARRQLEASRQ